MPDQEKWSINEALLQSYRSIFISSQSFFLAVGAIVTGKHIGVFLTVLFVGLVMIWAIWFPVVRARHRIVDYYKYGSRLSDPEKAKLCTERQYVHNYDLRKKANEVFEIYSNWRPTRRKVDALIPILFTAVWLALLIYEISTYYE